MIRFEAAITIGLDQAKVAKPVERSNEELAVVAEDLGLDPVVPAYLRQPDRQPGRARTMAEALSAVGVKATVSASDNGLLVRLRQDHADRLCSLVAPPEPGLLADMIASWEAYIGEHDDEWSMCLESNLDDLRALAAPLRLLYRVRDYWDGNVDPERKRDTPEQLLAEIHALLDPPPAAGSEASDV